MDPTAFKSLMKNMIKAAERPRDLTAAQEAEHINALRLLHTVQGRHDGHDIDWEALPAKTAFEMMASGKRIDLLLASPLNWFSTMAYTRDDVQGSNILLAYCEHTLVGRYLLIPYAIEDLMGEVGHETAIKDALALQRDVWNGFLEKGTFNSHTRIQSLHAAGRPGNLTSLGAMALAHLSPHCERVLASSSDLGDPLEMLIAGAWAMIAQQRHRMIYSSTTDNQLHPRAALAILDTVVDHAQEHGVDLGTMVMSELKFPERTVACSVPLCALMARALACGVRVHSGQERSYQNKIKLAKNPFLGPVPQTPLPRHIVKMASMIGNHIDHLPLDDRQEQLRICLKHMVQQQDKMRGTAINRRAISALCGGLNELESKQGVLRVLLDEITSNPNADAIEMWMHSFDPEDTALWGVGQEKDLKMILDFFASSFSGRESGEARFIAKLKQHMPRWFDEPLRGEAMMLLERLDNDQQGWARKTSEQRQAITLAWSILQTTWRQAPSERPTRKM